MVSSAAQLKVQRLEAVSVAFGDESSPEKEAGFLIRARIQAQVRPVEERLKGAFGVIAEEVGRGAGSTHKSKVGQIVNLQSGVRRGKRRDTRGTSTRPTKGHRARRGVETMPHGKTTRSSGTFRV